MTRVVLVVSALIPKRHRNFSRVEWKKRGREKKKEKKKNDREEIPFPGRIRIAYEFIMAIRGSLRSVWAKISTNVRIHDVESYKLPDGCWYSWDFLADSFLITSQLSVKWRPEVRSVIRVKFSTSSISHARIYRASLLKLRDLISRKYTIPKIDDSKWRLILFSHGVFISLAMKSAKFLEVIRISLALKRVGDNFARVTSLLFVQFGGRNLRRARLVIIA